MIVITKENLLTELKKSGTLKDLLRPEQFAEPDQVADKIAESYVKEGEMKTTQLRKVFHALKENERIVKAKKDEEELDPSTTTRIRLLVPEIAYARGRKLIPQEFYELMRLCLSSNKLKKVGDLRVLMQLLTAILAYQKYHEKVKGGKEQ
jgi:CRISPR-associated protein Csm2